MAEIGDKYIIEIGGKYKSDGVPECLYKAKGFNSLVFDDTGLSKLEKITDIRKKLDDYVAKVIESHQAELQKATDEAYKAGYLKGHNDGVETTKKEYEGKSNNNAVRMYVEGCDRMWDIAKEISNLWMNEENEELIEILKIDVDWGNSVLYAATHQLTAEEAIERFSEYQREKEKPSVEKENGKIKVGDEIFERGGRPFIVTNVLINKFGEEYYRGIDSRTGEGVQLCAAVYKTGRTFPEIAKIFSGDTQNN